MPSRDLLMGDMFRNAARTAPDRVAAALGDAVLTFSQLDQASNNAARAMAGLGVGRGDRVVSWCGTSLEAVSLFAAAAKLGAVFAPMNTGLALSEAQEMAETVTPALVVVDADRSDAGAELARRLGASAAGVEKLIRSSADPADVRCEDLKETDPHVIFFTSGSTGRSKGVVISHRVSYLRTHPGALIEPRGPMICPYPLFHMGAWTIAMQQWQARDRVVLMPSFDAATVCAAIERHRATRINAIPAIWRRILDYTGGPDGEHADLSSIRIADTGTSATPPELLEAIRRLLPGAALRIFYGSTEAGPVTMLEDHDIERKPGSCGSTAPGAELRLEPSGEILVRGPLVFDGYFDDPENTARAFSDGWFRTGDLAEMDGEGYLTIVGRARDLIRSGGESVAPTEVEQVLATHPAVADVAVVGLPDVQWGEIVCAVVVTAPGAGRPSLADLREWCDGRLARFKHPRRLAVVDSIPRTVSTNQVQRRLLAEQLS